MDSLYGTLFRTFLELLSFAYRNLSGFIKNMGLKQHKGD